VDGAPRSPPRAHGVRGARECPGVALRHGCGADGVDGATTLQSDIGGSAAGPPSKRIAVQVAFLQNTLEQAVLAVGLYLALATLLAGRWLVLIPVGVFFFVVGRVRFFRGYPVGVEGRALGMTCTMLPTVVGYLVALVLLVASGLGLAD
jgi:hypothetical protein